MLIFYDSPFIRVILSLGISLLFFSLIMILLSNPFSRYNHDQRIKDLCVTPSISSIEFSGQPIGNTILEISSKIYSYQNKSYNIIDLDYLDDASMVTIERADKLGQGFRREVHLSELKDCNPHPLPIMSASGGGDLLILGTTSGGYDYFSKLIYSFRKTLTLSLFALFSFLCFGLSMGIFIGYYKNRFKKTYFYVNHIQKMIESVPIIVWMIISYSFIDSVMNSNEWKIEIAFILFGVFSSTALSKLLVNKFEYFRKEDFIVALKLLGISDQRIIFVHILRYYCLPLIIMQIVYIVAQCFFIDITLSVIEFGDRSTLGYMFSNFYSNSSGVGQTHMIILSVYIYVIITSLFYSSEYMKVISTNE